MSVGVTEGQLLWTPSIERVERANITAFQHWLAAEGMATPSSVEELWRWSVDDLNGFWTAVRRWSGVQFGGDTTVVLADARMPVARWFPDATVNYAAESLRHDPDALAIVHRGEDDVATEITYRQLADEVRRCASGLRALGVTKGDRVAAYVPNRPQAIVAFLATASIGAIWTACSPDFGGRSVLDRFQQVEPVVLLTVTHYRYGGHGHDRRGAVAEIVAGLPSLKATVVLDDGTIETVGRQLRWDEVTAPTDNPLSFEPVAFDHPLWVLYTSGTTGLPKSIVHGHGGVILEHHKSLRLHLDVGPGDRFMWFTTTGWVMWNIVIGTLLVGATAVTYDGNPTHPTVDRLWAVAADTEATFVGASAGYIHACLREGVVPRELHDLRRVRSVGVTGSPLSPAGNGWLYDAIDRDVFVASISGGTDVCTAFVGGMPTLPVRAGHLQYACLGVAAAAFDESGRPVVGDVGELVITRPMPSMPVGFWGADGDERYRASYFDVWPDVWRHGDWVRFETDGSCVVLGRSDATLNRGGVRMGSAEFYAVLDGIGEISDSLVIDTSSAGDAAGELVLLAVPSSGTLDDAVVEQIRTRLRSELSPRHVPDRIIAVAALPHTLNGKRLEIPVRRLFLGSAVGAAVDPGAVDNRAALEEVALLAARWRAASVGAG